MNASLPNFKPYKLKTEGFRDMPPCYLTCLFQIYPLEADTAHVPTKNVHVQCNAWPSEKHVINQMLKMTPNRKMEPFHHISCFPYTSHV